MSIFGDDEYDDYDEFDDDFYDLLGEEPDTLVDDLVGTAWGHEPPYQPDTYDAYDSDEYLDFDSGEDEYFDGELNPIGRGGGSTVQNVLPLLPKHSSAPQQEHLASTIADLRKLRIEEKVREAMKGKKVYGVEPVVERHVRKRRKVESVDMGIVGVDIRGQGAEVVLRGDGKKEGGPTSSTQQDTNDAGDLGALGKVHVPPLGVKPTNSLLQLGMTDPVKHTSSGDDNACSSSPDAQIPTPGPTPNTTILPVPLPILGTGKKPKHFPPPPMMMMMKTPVSAPGTVTKVMASNVVAKKKAGAVEGAKKVLAEVLIPKKYGANGRGTGTGAVSSRDDRGGGGNTSPRKRKANTPLSPERQ